MIVKHCYDLRKIGLQGALVSALLCAYLSTWLIDAHLPGPDSGNLFCTNRISALSVSVSVSLFLSPFLSHHLIWILELNRWELCSSFLGLSLECLEPETSNVKEFEGDNLRKGAFSPVLSFLSW